MPSLMAAMLVLGLALAVSGMCWMLPVLVEGSWSTISFESL